MGTQNYKDLIVWQKSYNLTLRIYKICKKLPNDEIYGLRDQIRRCAVSIPSNIAEGQQRNGNNEFKHFIGIAKGSSAELETQLMLIGDIYDIDISVELKQIDEIQRMLQTLKSKL